ncbi:MAG: hypothetical protein ACKN9T_06725, partial [Candidatus Methylumidiphilus sp.]
MVAAALPAAPPPGHLAGQAAAYLGFFEFVHNLKRRGKRPLPSLLAQKDPETAKIKAPCGFPQG